MVITHMQGVRTLVINKVTASAHERSIRIFQRQDVDALVSAWSQCHTSAGWCSPDQVGPHSSRDRSFFRG